MCAIITITIILSLGIVKPASNCHAETANTLLQCIILRFVCMILLVDKIYKALAAFFMNYSTCYLNIANTI